MFRARPSTATPTSAFSKLARRTLHAIPPLFQGRGTSHFRAAMTGTAKEESESDSAKCETRVETEAPLPELSPVEFRQYNRMAEHMDYFHSNFRRTWNLLYASCSSSPSSSSASSSASSATSIPLQTLSTKRLISTGLQFASALTVHHSIEETYIFPYLARKQPAFRRELEELQRVEGAERGEGEGALVGQHRLIHEGLDRFTQYLEACRDGERELRREELRGIMDAKVGGRKGETWGTVLWMHLDEEVKELGAENMRRYWTLEEMRRIPM